MISSPSADKTADKEGPEAVSESCKCFILYGERGGNRTYNLLIKSQLLCQLSYAPTRGISEAGATLASPKISITSPARLSLRCRRFFRPERRRHHLRDVQEFWRRLGHRAQRIAEHRLAERARRADHRRAGAHQFLHALDVHPLALLLAKKHLPAARPAAERTFARAPRLHQFRRPPDHRPRLVAGARSEEHTPEL